MLIYMLINIIKYAAGMEKFASTDVMTKHLENAGIYPTAFFKKFDKIFTSILNIFNLLCLSFLGLKLKHIRKSYIYLFLIYLLIFQYFYKQLSAETYWLWLPTAIFIIFILLFQRIKNDIPLIIVIASGIIASQREFFALSLTSYGTYSFPLLFLCLIILIDKFCNKEIFKVKVRHILYSFIVILICFYFIENQEKRDYTSFKIETNKGTFYTNYKTGNTILNTKYYIEKHIAKDATILVLPEGNIINYITDRKVNMHCYMMDRLYHDAYGEETAKDIIAQSNSDYIILIKGFDINDFFKPYLYKQNETPSAKYIFDNYREISRDKTVNNRIVILKRKY